MLELIDGPTAIAFLEADSDPAAVAKVLNETARAHDVLVIRGGLLEGDLVGDEEIKRLATLPPADVLRAQLVGAVAGPLTTVVGLFTAPLRDFVGVLDARIRQLEEQGEAVPEPEPTPEPAAEEPAAEVRGSTRSRRAVRRAVGRSRAGFGRTRGGTAGWLRPTPTSSCRTWAG